MLLRTIALILFSISAPTNANEPITYDQYISEFEDYKTVNNQEFDDYKKLIENEYQQYKDTLSKVWDTPVIGNNHQWVWYSPDLTARAIIDFERETLSIDIQNNTTTIDAVLKHLLSISRKSAYEEDLLNQKIEKQFNAKYKNTVRSVINDDSILGVFFNAPKGLDEASIDKLSQELKSASTSESRTNSKGSTIVSVADISLQSPSTNSIDSITHTTATATDNSKIPLKGLSFKTNVEALSSKYNMDFALVYAIIETESSFNPMARSPIPAYGLMQIVPRTAGIDAAKKIYGKSKVFAPSYLYNSKNNIELGAAYLNVLYYRYFRKITNEKTKLYLTIAAYNTGTTNVARAITGIPSVSKSADLINVLTSEMIYHKLLADLPADETKHYLKKVTRRMTKYETP